MPTLQDSAIANTTANDSSITVAGIIPAGDNRVGFASICYFGAAVTVTDVTWGGVSIVANVVKNAVHDGVGRKRLAVFYYIAPPASSADVVFTLSGNTAGKTAIAQAWSDVDQTTPYGDLTNTADNAGGSSSDPHVLTQTADSGKILVDFYYMWNGATGGTFSQSQTLIEGTGAANHGGGANTTCHGSSYITSDGSVDHTWDSVSSANANWCMYAISLLAAAGGGGGITPPRGLMTMGVGRAPPMRERHGYDSLMCSRSAGGILLPRRRLLVPRPTWGKAA